MRHLPLLLCLLAVVSAISIPRKNHDKQVKYYQDFKKNNGDISIFLSSVYGATVNACKTFDMNVTFESYYGYMIKARQSNNIRIKPNEHKITEMLRNTKEYEIDLKRFCALIVGLTTDDCGDEFIPSKEFPTIINYGTPQKKAGKGRRHDSYSTEEDSYSDEYD